MKFQQRIRIVERKLFINGELTDSKGGQIFKVTNPATEEVFASAVASTDEDIDRAVKSARYAFDKGEWSKTDPAARGLLLLKLAQLIESNAEWLSYYETINSGKPLKMSRNQDVPFTAYIYRYFGGQTDKIKGSTLSMSRPFVGMTRKQPVGVVAQIIPWNYPLLMMAWKVAPALAAGCTVVIKPAQQTPFTALMIGELSRQAGFPKGVINVVPGFGQSGAYLAQHRLVDKISFTGSTEVGYLIMRNSHRFNLKPITLELGGKSANIILPDADFSSAVEQACILFSNAGQSCISGSRTFVHASIYNEFVEACAKVAESIVVGDPLSEDTCQGAIVCKQQFEKIMGLIGNGVREGARLVSGGRRVGKCGYFVQPTVFADVEDGMRIAREEIFGPVMSILKWHDEQQVIERANSLPYGLGAGVVTTSLDKALKFTSRLKAGTVYVNCYDYQEGCTPFGGIKDSGIGKDLGDEGLQGYLTTKTVIIKPKL